MYVGPSISVNNLVLEVYKFEVEEYITTLLYVDAACVELATLNLVEIVHLYNM